jgi:hypothetical protein
MPTDLMIILIIDIFAIMLGVIGVLSKPIISVIGIILSISVILVQVTSGNITDSLMLSLSITSLVISGVCFAVAWSK